VTSRSPDGIIKIANPVLAVAPLKEEAEMLRATDKITALYCRLVGFIPLDELTKQETA